MSQRDGFASGFLAGAILGSVIGGVIGALVTAGQRELDEEAQGGSLLKANRSEAKAMKGRKDQFNSEERIEAARRSLEDKIAQLNTAIDDVRQQLGTVNGSPERIDLEQSRDN